ncbi:MAG: DEAD/DEAH box helicase family protein [Bacteroidia bacterium]
MRRTRRRCAGIRNIVLRRKLCENILQHRRPHGDGKEGLFRATGCGKSYTMLFLTAVADAEPRPGQPTIVLITDRTDLDGQLSEQFTNAKTYIGDRNWKVVSVESHRAHLQEGTVAGAQKRGRVPDDDPQIHGGQRSCSRTATMWCASGPEAHRSQVNLEQE